MICVVFVIVKFFSFNDKINNSSNQTETKQEIKKVEINEKVLQAKNDSLCARSWNVDSRGIVYWIDKGGNYKVSSVVAFGDVSKCPLP